MFRKWLFPALAVCCLTGMNGPTLIPDEHNNTTGIGDNTTSQTLVFNLQVDAEHKTTISLIHAKILMR